MTLRPLQRAADQLGPLGFADMSPLEAAELIGSRVPPSLGVHIEGTGPVPVGALVVGTVGPSAHDRARLVYLYARWLTTGDAASALSLPRRTVVWWCEHGKIRDAIRTPSGRWRIPASSPHLRQLAARRLI